MVQAADPDLISDFVTPPNATIDGSFFTFTGLRPVFGEFPPNFKPTKARLAEFPPLSLATASPWPFFSILPTPSTHLTPTLAWAELLFVVVGNLQVGFVDTTNKFYNQTLQLGDIFMFPTGLVHFQFNADPQVPAMAVAAFVSAKAVTVSVPATVFTSGISDDVLAKAFRTDVTVIERIKAGLAVPN